MSAPTELKVKASDHPVLHGALTELRRRGVLPWQIDMPPVGSPIIHVSPPAAEVLGLVAETENTATLDAATLHTQECVWRGCRLRWSEVHALH